MFPLDRGELSVERYLLTLLLAAIKDAGGELKIKISSLITTDSKQTIIKRVDDSGDLIVLQSAAEGSELLCVRESAPRTSQSSSPRQRQPQQDDDVTKYLLEQRRAAEQAADRVEPGVVPWVNRQ